MPHGQCFLWEPGVLWLNVGSDLFIAVAYYIISAGLIYFLYKRRDIPFKPMFLLFGLFIFACGTTHVMHVWTVWHPDYWTEGWVKAGTAVLSFSTGLLLVPLIPKAMALRSPTELEQLNTRLTQAFAERQEAYATLEASQSQLMRRTDELIQQREQLRQLASQLTMTEQRERRKIAADLHDYLAQLLVVCRLKVSQAKRGPWTAAQAFLDELNGAIDQCLTYTRSLVSQLCPAALYQSGLVHALQGLAGEMKKHGLTVKITATDRTISAGDDAAIFLYQAVRELLFNIMKHAECSEADVRIRQTAQNEIEAVVRDQGVGFDASILSDPASSGRFGLFSVRERVEALGGRFEARSGIGTGTTIILALPVTDSPPYQSITTVLTPMRPFAGTDGERNGFCRSKLRVLLVDDHAMVRQGLRSVLEAYPDVEVLGEACDGEEAIQAVEVLGPSVVIMDINMPRMGGIEATRTIASRHPEVVVIGLSVNATDESRTTMLNAGASGLLTKEAAVEQLYSAMQQAVAGKRTTHGAIEDVNVQGSNLA